jgi:hypothetical protein
VFPRAIFSSLPVVAVVGENVVLRAEQSKIFHHRRAARGVGPVVVGVE